MRKPLCAVVFLFLAPTLSLHYAGVYVMRVDNEVDVRLDEFPSRSDVVYLIVLCRNGAFKPLLQVVFDSAQNEANRVSRIIRFDGLFRPWHDRAPIKPSRFEARERRPFACSMQTYNVFEKPFIGQSLRFWAFLSHLEGLFERIFQLTFCTLWYPDEDKIHISRV